MRIVTVAAGNYDFTRNEMGTSAYTRKKYVGSRLGNGFRLSTTWRRGVILYLFVGADAPTILIYAPSILDMHPQ